MKKKQQQTKNKPLIRSDYNLLALGLFAAALLIGILWAFPNIHTMSALSSIGLMQPDQSFASNK